ncbi:MAG TPA: hypothetical protein VD788_03850, partial [Candidatus Polarisedimenticolaceae bacterium]|nr:hypothetical protein [Candidatus Polarisedimenticolaceae bacterium]
VGAVTFSDIENLGGNVGDDDFVFADGASVTGGIDGGGGVNTLDYSAYTAGNVVTVSLGSGAVTGLGSVASIQEVLGGQGTGDTLIGPDADAEWHITGENAGTVLGISFAGFENLTGAAGNEDAFIFRPGGSLAGTLDGGPGGLDALAIEDPSSSDPDPKVLTAVVPDASGAGTQPFGDIYPGDARSVTYQGMDPYFLNAGGPADALIRTSVFGETLILEDGPGPTELQLRVTSAVLGTPFGSIELWNPLTSALIGPIVFEIPTSSLTIQTKAGNDSLTVTTTRLDNVADLDVRLEAGNLVAGSLDKDEIRLSSDILTRGGDLEVIAETIVVSAGTILSTRDAVGDQATAVSLGASGDMDFIGHSISVEDGAQLLSFHSSGAPDAAGLSADVVVESVELERDNIFGETRKIWEPGRSYIDVKTVAGAGSAGSGLTLDIITDTQGNPSFRIHERGSGYAVGDTVQVRVVDLKDASLNFLESKLLELFGGAEDTVIATLEVSELVVEGGDIRLSAIHKTNAVGTVFGVQLFPEKAHVSAEITIGAALIHGRDVILRAEADNNDPFNGELEAGKQKFDGVLDFLSEVRPLVGISDVSATATITIGDGAWILADADVVIEARADSAAEIRTLGIVGGVGYARSEADATVTVQGGATLAAAGDVAVRSIANNTVTANVVTSNLVARIPVDIAVGVTEAYSNAVTRVEEGAVIVAGGRADIWAIHARDLASEVSTSANFGMLGVAVLVSLSEANSLAEVAGTVTAADDVSVIAQTVSTQNQSQVASTIGLGFVDKLKKRITNPVADPVKGWLKGLFSGKKNTDNIPQSMKNSKFGLTAAVVVADHESSARATIATGAVVRSEGAVSVLADVVDRPVLSAESSIKKGFDRIAKTNFGIQKLGSVSAAVEIGTYTNEAQASIASGAQVDAQRGIVVAAHTLLPQDAPWANFFADDGAGTGAAIGDTLLDLFIGTEKAFATTVAKVSSDAKKVGLAGAVTVFNNRASAQASIEDGALINQNPDALWMLDQQDVTVSADTSVESVNLSGNL